MQPLNDFIHNLALIIGYTVLTVGFIVGIGYSFFSIAKRTRDKIPIIDFKGEDFAREPFIEDHEKGFTDDTFVDFKVKNKLEYSSN